MAWKSHAKTIVVVLVVVAVAALLARKTSFGQTVFGTTRTA